MRSTCQATVEVIPGDGYQASATRRVHTEELGTRRQLLADLLKGQDMALDDTQRQLLVSALMDMHGAFRLQEGERGETELVQFHIDTGDAEPRRQPPRRVPFAVRGEINAQLAKMQAQGVIRPSMSPWASPVVLAGQEEGWHIAVLCRLPQRCHKTRCFPYPTY